MEFIYAAQLKQRFTCYGHFYELATMDGSRYPCRSVLEIADASVPQQTPDDISLMIPDLVAVMMNPGSSHPRDRHHVDRVIDYGAHAGTARKELVLTQPDNTQYQLMRIAVQKGWRHIRVLNLSDLRDPKSAGFLKKAETLTGVMGGHTHSIFCRERAEECRRSLERKGDAPVLLGWGQDPGLLSLADQCLTRLTGECVCRVPSEVHPLLNAHPSPMLQAKKLLWLERIMEEL
jgi:hypothetical protein